MNLAKRFTPSELPRERLLRDGIEALSLQELVAILLGTGTQGKSVLILAQELLLSFGGIEGLCNASVEELVAIKGMGQAKAILLKAAMGIALRKSKEQQAPRRIVMTIGDAVEIARPAIGHFSKEALLVILRDVKCRLIHHEVISIGTLHEVLVHPREVFKPAVHHCAQSLIVCHNHPSGDTTPSDADIRLTKNLAECSKIMGITLADHLIITKQSHLSLRKFGAFPEK